MIRAIDCDRRAPRAKAAPDRPQPPAAHLVLGLQRAAGNRAVSRILARSVTADVLTNDLGDIFADKLTPDELRQQVELIVTTLEHGNAEPAARQTMEQNLEFLEGYGAADQIALP